MKRLKAILALVLLISAFLLPAPRQASAALPAPVQVSTGKSPNSIALNEQTNKIYVTNSSSSTVTVIDGTTNAVAATINVGNSPADIAIDEVRNVVYVANLTGNSVSVINGATNAVSATIGVSSRPRRIAVDPVTNKIYVAHNSGSRVTIIDGNTLTELARVANEGSPNGIAVNEETHKAYVANNSGMLTIIGADNTATTVALGEKLTAVDVNQSTNKVYVANDISGFPASDGEVFVIDGETDSVAATIATEIAPMSIAINEVTNTVYVPNQGSASLTVINGATDTADATVSLASGSGPIAAAVDPSTNTVFIANNSSNNMTVVDGSTQTVSTLNLNNTSRLIAINRATNKVYLVSAAAMIVSVVYTLEDLTPPVVQFSENGNVAASISASTTVTVTDAESGVLTNALSYVWSQDTTAPSTGYWAFASGSELPLDVSRPNGLYYLYVKASDRAGNTTTVRSNSFLLDNAAPVVTITGSGIGTVNGPFSLEVSFDDPVTGFDPSDLIIKNGTLTNFNPAVNRMNFTVDITPLTSGQQVTLRVPAYAAADPAGNHSLASETYSVLYDTTKPTIVLNGFTDNQIFNVPPSSFSVSVSESVYRTSDNSAIAAEDAALLISMKKDGAPFTEYSTSYDSSTITYTVAFEDALEDAVYTLDVAGGVVKNLRNNTLDAVSASFSVAKSVVTGLTANPVALPSAGGNVSVSIEGRNLTGQMLEAYLDGEAAATAIVNGPESAEAVVELPANATTSGKLHRLTVYLNGAEVLGLSSEVTVSGRQANPPHVTPIAPRNVAATHIDMNGEWIEPNEVFTDKPVLAFDLTPKNEVVYVGIPADVLEDWKEQNAELVIEIRTPYANYRVPVGLASLVPGLADWLATENRLELSDIAFRIKLTDKSSDPAIQAAFKRSLPSGKLLGPIVDFIIEIVNVNTGQAIGDVTDFSERIDRLIPLSVGLTGMPQQWGAFRYDEKSGKFGFIPAVSEKNSGAWSAIIRSNTNSIYAIADNPINFSDMEKHWARAYVDRARAKGLVEGIGNGLYDPNRQVTRAEFVTMLMRALGGTSEREGNETAYDDVKRGAWYYDKVMQAKAMGLLAFADSKRFNPNQSLTRQEMAGILASAVKLERPQTAPNAIDFEYSDIADANPALLEDMRLMVQLGIMKGMSATEFGPTDQTTRAQTAIVLIRTLQTLDLID